MKPLAVLLLFAATLSATAQQPEITGLTADGTLAWTNAESNTHCAVDYLHSLTSNCGDLQKVPFDSSTRALLARYPSARMSPARGRPNSQSRKRTP